MKPSHVALGMLALLAAAAASGSYALEQALDRGQGALGRAQQELQLERDRVALLERLRAQEAEQSASRAALAERLVGDNPFREMEQALEDAAAAAGVRLNVTALSGAEPVEGLPELVQYTADIEVTGTFPQLTAFVRQLEQHRLLLAIPDLNLELGDTPQDAFTARFAVGFFRAVGG